MLTPPWPSNLGHDEAMEGDVVSFEPHFRQMVNLAIIFKIHACINWNYIEYIIIIA